VRRSRGTWKDLTETSKNIHGDEPHQKVREIAKVVTTARTATEARKAESSRARRDALLAGHHNNMTGHVALFATRCSDVAREVGNRGQARRPGPRPALRSVERLTGNVNQLAATPHHAGACDQHEVAPGSRRVYHRSHLVDAQGDGRRAQSYKHNE